MDEVVTVMSVSASTGTGSPNLSSENTYDCIACALVVDVGTMICSFDGCEFEVYMVVEL